MPSCMLDRAQLENRAILTQHNVSENLVVSHLDVANGDTEAENFLQLELDGGSDLVDLVGKIFGMRHRRREFSSYNMAIKQYDYWPRV